MIAVANYKKALIVDWLEEECWKRQLSPIYLDYDLVHKFLVNLGGMSEEEYLNIQNQWLDDEMNHRVSYHNYNSEFRLDNLINSLKAVKWIEQSYME